MAAVFTLLSGKKLDKREFCRYVSKKIEKTSKKFNIKSRTNKVYCLDDAAIDIMFGLMTGKKIKLRKTAFLYCLKKELVLYSQLRNVQFNFIEYKGLKSNIKGMLDQLERKHPEIKYSILNAQLNL